MKRKLDENERPEPIDSDCSSSQGRRKDDDEEDSEHSRSNEPKTFYEEALTRFIIDIHCHLAEQLTSRERHLLQTYLDLSSTSPTSSNN